MFPFILLGVSRDYSVHTLIQTGSVVNPDDSTKLCDVVFVRSAMTGARNRSLPGCPKLQKIPLLLTHPKVQNREQLKIS